MTKHSAARAPGRVFRALAAYSARTAASYRSVFGPRATPHRTAEEIALHG
jgi:hypothetical protein